MKYKAIIFDLDGTLLNSLVDIADSVNIVLKKYNLPTHPIDDYKLMVGKGIKSLVEEALPNNVNQSDFDKYFAEVTQVYENNQINKTQPYSGIIDMLKALEDNGTIINILSNKPIDFTKMVVSHFLGEINFKYVIGARKGVPQKPNPISVFEIIEGLELDKSEVLYVGDTGTDMKTAENAGLSSVGVLWGFRGLEELMENGAEYIIEEPSKIVSIVEGSS